VSDGVARDCFVTTAAIETNLECEDSSVRRAAAADFAEYARRI
jgi:hypothetical protein